MFRVPGGGNDTLYDLLFECSRNVWVDKEIRIHLIFSLHQDPST